MTRPTQRSTLACPAGVGMRYPHEASIQGDAPNVNHLSGELLASGELSRVGGNPSLEIISSALATSWSSTGLRLPVEHSEILIR